MHLLLASFGDTATNPWALAFLGAGLLGSVAIGAGPPLRQFARQLPVRLAATRQEALEIARNPSRAAASAEAVAQLPRAAFSYGLLGLLLAAWAAYAFTQPATERRPIQVEYVTSFGYLARGAPSVALPGGAIGPVSAETVAQTGGQPTLYSAVLSDIGFAYNYEMRAPQRLQVVSAGGAALRIRAQDGWERTIELQPTQPLGGAKSTMWFTASLDSVRLVIAGVELTTGSKSDWYDLTVIPVVRLAGQLGSAHIDETYSREFNLRYDRVHITPDAELNGSERKAGNTRVEEHRQVHAFGISMELGAARWAAALGAVVALGGAALLVIFRPIPGAGPGAPPDRPPSNASAAGAKIADAAAAAAKPPPAAIPAATAASVAPAAAASPPPAPASATATPAGLPAAAAASVSSSAAVRAAPFPPSAAPGAATPAPAPAPLASPPDEQVNTRETLNRTAHTESDELLAASVAPSANGALHPAGHRAPPVDVEQGPGQEPPPA